MRAHRCTGRKGALLTDRGDALSAEKDVSQEAYLLAVVF